MRCRICRPSRHSDGNWRYDRFSGGADCSLLNTIAQRLAKGCNRNEEHPHRASHRRKTMVSFNYRSKVNRAPQEWQAKLPRTKQEQERLAYGFEWRTIPTYQYILPLFYVIYIQTKRGNVWKLRDICHLGLLVVAIRQAMLATKCGMWKRTSNLQRNQPVKHTCAAMV